MRGRTIALAAVLLAVTFVAQNPEPAGAAFDPTNFTSPKANPYYPLVPGTTSVYRGTEDGDRLVEHLTVTDRTRTIAGVQAIVVRDILFANGRLQEKTTDWYQNDNGGSTWYFGEDTAVYNRKGQIVSTEGSWMAGVHGAIAGLIMPASPVPTDAYRQEYLRRHAEDQGWIVSNRAKVTTPAGAFTNVVRSYEWTRLEPNVVSLKFYAPGVGIVTERDVAGGTESLELVAVHHH
jgi:hypothetical protein